MDCSVDGLMLMGNFPMIVKGKASPKKGKVPSDLTYSLAHHRHARH
jgi:hypothetical protein